MILPLIMPVHAAIAHGMTHAVRKVAAHTAIRMPSLFRSKWQVSAVAISAVVALSLYMQKRLAVVQNIFSHLNISRKLALGFGILILLSVTGFATVFTQTKDMRAVQDGNVTSDHIVDLLDAVHAGSEGVRDAVRDFVIDGKSAERAQAMNFARQRDKDARAARQLILSQASELLPAFDRYVASQTSYDRAVAAPYLKMLARGQSNAVAASMRSGFDDAYRIKVEQNYDRLRNQAELWSQQWDDKSEASINDTVMVVAVGGVLVTAFGVALAGLFAQSISGPLTTMTGVMRTLAQGELHAQVPFQKQSDEIGDMAKAVNFFQTAAIEKNRLEEQAAGTALAIERERADNEAQRAEKVREQSEIFTHLARSLSDLAAGNLAQRLESDFPQSYEGVRRDFNEAIEHLHMAMQHVVGITSDIEQASGLISDASDDLNDRANRQAQTLEQTSATLNGITRSVEDTALGVAQARTSFAEARCDAERAHDLMARAMTAMGMIDSASKEIAAFTDSIDMIASQTNLLALNATVEAARAGDAGRGFAVVAGEVGLLAKKCTDMVREIRALTQSSVGQIESGVTLVGDMGDSFTRIVRHVVAIDEIADDIANASASQSMALIQVNGVLRAIDGETRETANRMHISASHAHRLSGQAQALSNLVGKFQL